MPNLYARATALPNVVGRVNYISSPHRQERLLAAYDGAADLLEGKFWHQLAKESQAAFEQFGYENRAGQEKKLKCCEGREIMILLSNALLQRMSPDEIVKVVVEEFKEKLGLTVAAGLHLKHNADGPDNLHVHVVFPERELLKEPVIKIADRALFFDAQGKRRYKKSEILDENKQLLPGCRIVKKGEIYEQRYFGSVDSKYSSKSWIKDVKTNVILPLRNGKLKGDIEITEFDASTGKLAQQHIGNNVRDPEIRERIQEYNNQVKKWNQLIDAGYVQGKNRMIGQRMVYMSGNRNETLSAVTVRVLQIRENALNQARAEMKERKIYTRRDWDAQRMVDAVRVARELGATNAAELERKKEELGRELGQVKREYAAAQQIYGEGSQELQKAEKRLRDAKKDFVATARAVEATFRKPSLDDQIANAAPEDRAEQEALERSDKENIDNTDIFANGGR